ncbi:uncharacterized protein LAJ45_00575 [Morchella importuna]|uniref:uncharacterized protein n=1 Tax=Morchella importuna TaxID=1174673 RepID=UPI001E8D2878|nr:uncharacterized protein LAJ45_00575 [Morchella importuna]KAH8155565.1 hypothetical protein LAJ45_00575 [Morchella importuna]
MTIWIEAQPYDASSVSYPECYQTSGSSVLEKIFVLILTHQGPAGATGSRGTIRWPRGTGSFHGHLSSRACGPSAGSS